MLNFKAVELTDRAVLEPVLQALLRHLPWHLSSPGEHPVP